MYETKLAYRHENGEIEGFKGFGFTKESSENDCLKQIINKLKLLEKTFNNNQLKRSFAGLTKEEKEQIRKDWNTNIRY